MFIARSAALYRMKRSVLTHGTPPYTTHELAVLCVVLPITAVCNGIRDWVLRDIANLPSMWGNVYAGSTLIEVR